MSKRNELLAVLRAGMKGREYRPKERRDGKMKYPWRTMRVGDSLYVPGQTAAGSAARTAHKLNITAGKTLYVAETVFTGTAVGCLITRLDTVLQRRWDYGRRDRNKQRDLAAIAADLGVTVDDIKGKPVDNTATPG